MLAELFTLLVEMIEALFTRRRSARPEEIRRFYRSVEWKRVRFEVLTRSPRCAVCGTSAKDGAGMNVAHIQPLSRRWDLRLKLSNLRTTCASCNWGRAGDSIFLAKAPARARLLIAARTGWAAVPVRERQRG